jgi:hypothetical protein
MTVSLCVAAWLLLSLPAGLYAVWLMRDGEPDDPTAPGAVGATPPLFLPPKNLSARRTAPNANATSARVFSNPRMVAGDKP